MNRSDTTRSWGHQGRHTVTFLPWVIPLQGVMLAAMAERAWSLRGVHCPQRSTLIWQVKKTGILEGEIRHPKGAWEVLSVWGPCCVLSLVSAAIQAALSGETGLSEAPGQMLMKWAIVSEINSLPRALQGFYGFSATGKGSAWGQQAVDILPGHSGPGESSFKT